MESAHKVQYTVIRSKKRKRLALQVTDTGTIQVRSPYYASIREIDTFVATHERWIERHLAAVRQLPQPLADHTWRDGDQFLYLGNRLTLRVIRSIGRKTFCTRVDDLLVVYRSTQAKEVAVRNAIIAWYRAEGAALYETLVSRWVVTIGAPKVTGTEIKRFPRRWGSCSRKRKLSFSLRSLMLPMPLVDYLALHEVAHLVYFNHGSQFRALLDTYMSDWRERQQELNRYRLQAANL